MCGPCALEHHSHSPRAHHCVPAGHAAAAEGPREDGRAGRRWQLVSVWGLRRALIACLSRTVPAPYSRGVGDCGSADAPCLCNDACPWAAHIDWQQFLSSWLAGIKPLAPTAVPPPPRPQLGAHAVCAARARGAVDRAYHLHDLRRRRVELGRRHWAGERAQHRAAGAGRLVLPAGRPAACRSPSPAAPHFLDYLPQPCAASTMSFLPSRR